MYSHLAGVRGRVGVRDRVRVSVTVRVRVRGRGRVRVRVVQELLCALGGGHEHHVQRALN